jgi:hypothetical protein
VEKKLIPNQLKSLRKQYHENISKNLLSIRKEHINIADTGSASSCLIAEEMAKRVGGALCQIAPSGQTAGNLFSVYTKEYLESVFSQLSQVRPGPWVFKTERPISEADQYKHLADLDDLISQNPKFKATLGTDYLIQSDIVVYRIPLSDEALGISEKVQIATNTPLRKTNHPTSPPTPLMHASISCKWTMRSDRSQNTRTEALNLIRNRKGHTPHITAVTAEPLPMRIASLALGTGDLDCVYHFALYELIDSLESMKNITNPNTADQFEMLNTLIEGRRLRDISDLPFDLAI